MMLDEVKKAGGSMYHNCILATDTINEHLKIATKATSTFQHMHYFLGTGHQHPVRLYILYGPHDYTVELPIETFLYP